MNSFQNFKGAQKIYIFFFHSDKNTVTLDIQLRFCLEIAGRVVLNMGKVCYKISITANNVGSVLGFKRAVLLFQS